MKKLLLSVVIILAMLVISGVSCEQAPESGTGTGTGTGTGILKLYLSDAPLDTENVTGVYITIEEIQYHLNGELGELILPAGNYTQIRFILDIPEKGPHPVNPGCYIEFDGNSTEPLFVPSGGQTGYKAIGRFEVPANGTVEVTADWDVLKAVVVANSRYILKPTIKLIVND